MLRNDKPKTLLAAPRHNYLKSQQSIALPVRLQPRDDDLDRRLVGDRCDALRLVVLCTDCPRFPWHGWLPLQADLRTVLLRLAPLLCVGLHTAQELLTGT
jgi:hypothetical protein